MLKLYYTPGACSLAPHLALVEAGLAFELQQVDLSTKTVGGKNYKQINPKGSVPALKLDNGEVLTEAAVILQYIADRKPEAGLLPAFGTWERYRALEWLNYVATEIHKGFGPLWNPTTPAEYKSIVIKMLQQRFTFLDNHFANHEYLLGQSYSVADAYLFTVTSWSSHHKLDLSPHTHLLQFMERVKGRPGTVAALKAEGLA